MNAFKITTDSGNSWITQMNCSITDATDYFMGHVFYVEDNGFEIAETVISVVAA